MTDIRFDPQEGLGLRDHPDIVGLPRARPAIPGRILHVTRASAPRSDGKTGKAAAKLHADLVRLGLDVHVVGAPNDYEGYSTTKTGFVSWHTTPGSPRDGADHEVWAVRYAMRVAAILRKVRPAVIIGDTDPVIDSVCDAVGHNYIVPTIRRSRGKFATYSAIQAMAALGVLPHGAEDLLEQQLRDRQLDRLSQAASAAESAPLERLHWLDDAALAAETQANGWIHAGLPPLKLNRDTDWKSVRTADRSHALWLHAWDFMRPALGEFVLREDAGALRWCLDLATGWCRVFGAQADPGADAWYDMALSLRLPKLAFLTQEVAKMPGHAQELRLLAQTVLIHEIELLQPRSFKGHNNHGLYTALAQVALGRRLPSMPGAIGLGRQGEDRISRLVLSQFAEDGGHLEHSPEYHLMLAEDLSAAVGDGLIRDELVVERVEIAKKGLDWFVKPDGRLIQIGDTSERIVESRGTEHGAYAFRRSGYAVARQAVKRRGTAEVAYATLTAGFHSRTHKHADDLSVTWFDRNREILIDPGKWGYLDPLDANHPDRRKGFYYSREERQYVESTRAHCTAQVNGEDHDRVAREPYGSGIREARNTGDGLLMQGEVHHGFWTHRRSVLLRPGETLTVHDEVSVVDEAPHRLRIWWQLPGDFSVVDGGPARFQCPDFAVQFVQSGSEMSIIPPVTEQRNPLQGWRSMRDRELTPAWSLAFETLLSGGHFIGTTTISIE